MTIVYIKFADAWTNYGSAKLSELTQGPATRHAAGVLVEDVPEWVRVASIADPEDESFDEILTIPRAYILEIRKVPVEDMVVSRAV